jgi:hypothetical protein
VPTPCILGSVASLKVERHTIRWFKLNNRHSLLSKVKRHTLDSPLHVARDNNKRNRHGGQSITRPNYELRMWIGEWCNQTLRCRHAHLWKNLWAQSDIRHWLPLFHYTKPTKSTRAIIHEPSWLYITLERFVKTKWNRESPCGSRPTRAGNYILERMRNAHSSHLVLKHWKDI